MYFWNQLNDMFDDDGSPSMPSQRLVFFLLLSFYFPPVHRIIKKCFLDIRRAIIKEIAYLLADGLYTMASHILSMRQTQR